MLTEYVIPKLEELQPLTIFQQDGNPPHWNMNVRNYHDTVFLENGSVRVVQFHGYLVDLTALPCKFLCGVLLRMQATNPMEITKTIPGQKLIMHFKPLVLTNTGC